LSLSDREEISRGIVAEQSLRQIAMSLKRATSTRDRLVGTLTGNT
jgi:IS30 family transposase